MSQDINDLGKYVNRLFNYSYKFQNAITTATNVDNGQLSTNSGYNENSLDNIGSVGGADKPQHGSPRIQLNSTGTATLPIDLGESPWISG